VRERVKSDTATHTEVALAEARPVLIDDRLALRLRAHQNPEREVLESRVTREFAAFVSLMSPEHKAVLALHYYAGLELRDIAKYFRVPESRVGQMHIKAIMAVRDFLAYRQ
jgi:DNA-directed RNA polymerase specialized sigma subunit